MPQLDDTKPARWKYPVALALLVTLFLLPTSCGRGGQEVLVFAAASLRDVLIPLGEEYKAKHNVTVKFSWGGSVTLARQLEFGAPGDLFISAGAAPMDKLDSQGLLTPHTRAAILSNRLVVVLPLDADPGPQTLRQALAASPRVALADPKLAPSGRYAQELLRSLGLWEDMAARMVFGGDVRAALAYVESKAADAGIVYLTDALNSGRVQIAHEVPPGLHSPIVYPAAVLKTSDRQDAAAKFLAFLQAESSQAHFRSHGFQAPDAAFPNTGNH